jgi:glycosyltransferase involved in cell wall biosynthesis
MHLVYSFGFGGMEVGVAKLANALDPATVAVSICSGKPSEQLKYRLRPEVGFFELGRRPGNDPGLIVRLARVLRRERPHILHTHGWATIVEGLLAARLASVPVLIHGEHGTLELRPFNRRVQRWAWGRATRVIAVSSRLAERMEQHIGFPAARIHVIRNGVDTVRFTPALRPEARAEFGFGPDDLVLGTAGRLVPVKDQATLLRAWALLRQRGVQFTGVIAGRGALKDELEGLAATLGLDNVRFLGNRPDVERVMAALDVFILSSVSEGLSNTIQEAMASPGARRRRPGQTGADGPRVAPPCRRGLRARRHGTQLHADVPRPRSATRGRQRPTSALRSLPSRRVPVASTSNIAGVKPRVMFTRSRASGGDSVSFSPPNSLNAAR